MRLSNAHAVRACDRDRLTVSARRGTYFRRCLCYNNNERRKQLTLTRKTTTSITNQILNTVISQYQTRNWLKLNDSYIIIMHTWFILSYTLYAIINYNILFIFEKFSVFLG